MKTKIINNQSGNGKQKGKYVLPAKGGSK